jgi:hypothetical protein
MKRLTGNLYQCVLCEEHFSGASPYGLHFHPDTGACLTCDELRAIGMTVTSSGFWALPSSASKRPILQSPVSAEQAIAPTPCHGSGFDDRQLEAAP